MWAGVNCTAGHVTNLWRDGNQLSGSIPESLGNLSNLSQLFMKSNKLNGSIPESLGNLSKLKLLELEENQLSGSIPESLGNLSNLVELALEENQLNGSIPESLGNLSNLEWLLLNDNQLSGSIPKSLGNLSNLVELALEENQLNGPIPESLGNLSNLKELHLGENRLSGSIPEWLGSLSNLTYLRLGDNQLSGSIPESLGNLGQLYELSLSSNKLSGSIPESLGKLNNLQILKLENNQLSGSIPKLLGNMSLLAELFLSNNELCGNIPLSFIDSDVWEFSINNNHLTTSDPDLIEWLDSFEPDWAETQTTPYTCSDTETPKMCSIYGVHDGGLNNSQIFTVNPNTLEVNKLGDMKKGHDIEALDIHPQTDELYAASGDDTSNKGLLYKVDKASGLLTTIGSTGCDEVDALSFHPDGTLWGWAQDCGLLTIDTNTGKADVIIPASQVEVEDITWNTAGTTLYGVENQHGNHHPDSHGPLDFDQGVKLWTYNSENGISTVCDDITQSLKEIEALETLPDDSLLFSFHGISSILNVGTLDVQNCQLIAQEELPTVPYNDVEGIAWPANGCDE
jgi:hypothetical protein